MELSALSRGIISKDHSDFYCLNCLHSFATENKREYHKKVYKSKDICDVIMLSEDTKIYIINIKNLKKHHLLFMQILNF